MVTEQITLFIGDITPLITVLQYEELDFPQLPPQKKTPRANWRKPTLVCVYVCVHAYEVCLCFVWGTEGNDSWPKKREEHNFLEPSKISKPVLVGSIPVTDQKSTNTHWDVFAFVKDAIVTTRSLAIFGQNSLFNFHLQMLLVVRPNEYNKMIPQRQRKTKHLVKRRDFESKKSWCRQTKPNVPKKEAAMIWFFCFGQR